MTAEELVRVYRPVVLRYSMRLAGDAAEAEDLAQETLLKAVRGLPRFEGRSTPASWLFRIAVNAWKNRLRVRACRREEPIAREDEAWAAPEPTPEGWALAEEKRRALDAALAGLSDGEREALLLRALGGLSYCEISRAQGVAVGTVKSRLSRARGALKATAVGLVWAAAAAFMVLLGGAVLKKAMPGLFAQIQGMISGAANTMGAGSGSESGSGGH